MVWGGTNCSAPVQLLNQRKATGELVIQRDGQEERVTLVIGVLEAAVLCNLRRIGQHDRVARRLQSVHQPIPVIGGLHGQLFQPVFEGRQKLADAFEFTRQFLMRQPFAFPVHDAHHNVVAMQVDPSH